MARSWISGQAGKAQQASELGEATRAADRGMGQGIEAVLVGLVPGH